MVVGADGSRPLTINMEGDSVMPLATIIDSVSVDGAIIEKSGTRFDGPRADIVELVP